MTGGAIESNVPDGDVLIGFAEAMVGIDEDALATARATVVAQVGAAQMVDAAGVASNFERMVRIADSTGIELGEALEGASADVREALQLTQRTEVA